jgi:transcriptional regulator with XRE-family HTH domain
MIQEWRKRVKGLMKLKRLGQEDIAPCLKVSRSAVSHYLSGRSTPTLEQLDALSKFLKVTPQYLVYGGENMVEVDQTLLDSCSQAVWDCSNNNKLELTNQQQTRIIGYLYNEAQHNDHEIYTDERILAVASLTQHK